jgi:hypothetical protein
MCVVDLQLTRIDVEWDVNSISHYSMIFLRELRRRIRLFEVCDDNNVRRMFVVKCDTFELGLVGGVDLKKAGFIKHDALRWSPRARPLVVLGVGVVVPSRPGVNPRKNL